MAVVGVCVFAGGCTCLEWGDLPGVYLPGVRGIPARGVPTWGRGCTCPSGFVYLPKGELCTCQAGEPAGKAPTWRVYLPGDVYLPGGIVPTQGVYLPGGPAQEGVPSHGGVSQHAPRV